MGPVIKSQNTEPVQKGLTSVLKIPNQISIAPNHEHPQLKHRLNIMKNYWIYL